MPKTPITSQSFDAAWRYCVRKHYWAKKKGAARGAITLASQVLFFCVFLILTYGIVYDLSRGLLRQLMNMVPQAAEAWKAFSEVLFRNALTDQQKLLRMLLLLYGIPLAAGILIFLLVGLFYHPLTPGLPQEEAGRARELWVLSQHIRNFQEKKSSRSYVFLGLLFGVIAAGSVMLFFLYYNKRPEIARQLKAAAGQSQLYFFLAVMAVFLGYWLLSLPMFLLLLPLHTSYVPVAFHKNVDAYYEQLRTAHAPEA